MDQLINLNKIKIYFGFDVFEEGLEETRHEG